MRELKICKLALIATRRAWATHWYGLQCRRTGMWLDYTGSGLVEDRRYSWRGNSAQLRNIVAARPELANMRRVDFGVGMRAARLSES